MNPYFVGVVVPLIISLIYRNSKGNKKQGLPADVGGESGYALRNFRSVTPLVTAWEGVLTLAQLFEESCMKYPQRRLIGTRTLVSKETEVIEGRSFEKLHLGEYEWLTFERTFEAVCNFSSGLAYLGINKEERVAIFSDTRGEWLIAAQVSFLFSLL